MFIKSALFLFLTQFVLGFTQENNIVSEKDYIYISETESYYKFHTLPRTLNRAKAICEFEGATLYYPETDVEVDAVSDHWSKTQPSITWVFTNLMKNDLITRDGTFKTGHYAKWHTGEPNNIGGNEECITLRFTGTINDENCNREFPFICVKRQALLQRFQGCNSTDSVPLDYMFNITQGSYYTFRSTRRNWMDAYAICTGDLSYLAIVDDETEAAFLVDFLNKTLQDYPCILNAELIHSGFFNMNGWKTVKGVPLHTSGYNKWAPSQPDGGISEECGAMAADGSLHDIDCSQEMYFICEHGL